MHVDLRFLRTLYWTSSLGSNVVWHCYAAFADSYPDQTGFPCYLRLIYESLLVLRARSAKHGNLWCQRLVSIQVLPLFRRTCWPQSTHCQLVGTGRPIRTDTLRYFSPSIQGHDSFSQHHVRPSIKMVDPVGIEPTTYGLQSRCSPSWAKSP